MQREVRGPLGGFGLGEIGARRGPGLMRYRVEEKGGAHVRANLLQSERQIKGREGKRDFAITNAALRGRTWVGKGEGRPSEKREGESRCGGKRASWNSENGEQEEGSSKGEGERTE